MLTETPAFKISQRPKVAVGISLGGNMLANYLADYADDPSAATIVSAPADLACLSEPLSNKAFQTLKKVPAQFFEIEDALKAYKLLQREDWRHLSLESIKKIDKLYKGLTRRNRMNDRAFMTDDVIPKFVLPDNIDYRRTKKVSDMLGL